MTPLSMLSVAEEMQVMEVLGAEKALKVPVRIEIVRLLRAHRKVRLGALRVMGIMRIYKPAQME